MEIVSKRETGGVIEREYLSLLHKIAAELGQSGLATDSRPEGEESKVEEGFTEFGLAFLHDVPQSSWEEEHNSPPVEEGEYSAAVELEQVAGVESAKHTQSMVPGVVVGMG